MKAIITCQSSRSLTQEEIDCHHRYNFVKSVLDGLENHQEVKFIVLKNNHALFTCKRNTCGWEFSLGKKYWYSYKLSDLVSVLEQFYDEAALISLSGELQLEAIHVTANPNAE